jgi:hypothetical protein
LLVSFSAGERLRYREIAEIFNMSLGAVSLSFGPSLPRIARRRAVRLMNYKDHPHLSDQQLLDVKGEISTHDEKAFQSHLDACWKCRARRPEIENAIADFIRIHQREFGAKLPPAAGRRALLKAQLARLSATALRSGWFALMRRWDRALAAAALGLAVLGLFVAPLSDSKAGHARRQRFFRFPIPDSPPAPPSSRAGKQFVRSRTPRTRQCQ